MKRGWTGVGSQHHTPSAFSPVNSPDYHYTQGWLGPRASLDGSGQQKVSCPHRVSNPEPSSS